MSDQAAAVTDAMPPNRKRTPAKWALHSQTVSGASSLRRRVGLLTTFPHAGRCHGAHLPQKWRPLRTAAKRSSKVDSHKGEISFPGGKRDPEDTTMLDTALRETHEEMGVRPQDVEVFGALDQTATTSGFCTSPFAGTIPYPYDFQPCEDEVAVVLEVPVSSLLDRVTGATKSVSQMETFRTLPYSRMMGILSSALRRAFWIASLNC